MRSNENTDHPGKLTSFYDVFHKIEDELNNLYEKSMVCFSNNSKNQELKLQKITEGKFNPKINKKSLM